MASIVSDKNGRKRLLVILPDGNRKPIRLGKLSQRNAETIKYHVEELVGSKTLGRAPADATAQWLATLEDDGLLAKLAKVRLTEPRESVTLGQLVDGWLERRRASLKPGTLVRLEQAKRSLVAYFTADRALGAVSEGEVEDYRAKLLADGLAEATVRKRCSDARVWFRYALRRGFTRSNPFECVPTAATATPHLAYISDADAKLVMEQISDPDLRLIFALARWGGMRIVSEPKGLTWDCIDWARSRIVVKSPKTDRHAGHEQRVIPLFPELAGPLQDAFDRAKEGETYVVPSLHKISSAALRKPMFAAIKRAGVKPWARLWHNLRSSRQTELEQRFPSHVVCSWLGNSTTIARRHYLQILDTDFAKAVAGGASLEAAHEAAQKAAQQAHARVGNGPQDQGRAHEKTPVSAGVCDGFPLVAELPDDPNGI